MESNEILDRLPRHLLSLVIDQPYNKYTAQDHAVWRYVMRQNVRYLPGVAHASYLQGLKRTGISIDQIPHMYGMNRILKEIGWAAVAVDGFIPPAAFMEFQAYNVLVIAADIRPVNQILYTPAPDIIHEAAGHAPIIADEEYSCYLRDFGRVGTKAFSSVHDNKLYEAIRHLSILKADPFTPIHAIEKAESELEEISKLQQTLSEMALLRNLHWWTVEYGLIGTIENAKIYGAGLLSSIGESHNCMKPTVKKLPYTLDAQKYTFDITTQQPQLFVTPDFEHLNTVLQQYTDTMAFRTGGLESLNKALQSGTTCTVVFSSELQVSGKLVKIYKENNDPVYLGFEGPSMLSYDNQQLEGHGIIYHKDGFGSPVGNIKGFDVRLESMSESDLTYHSILKGNEVELNFVSGVNVKGRLEKITTKKGRNLIFSFQNCTVRYKGKDLFKPEWGMYDMAVGDRITSAFAGPADPDSFALKYRAPEEKTHHIMHTGSLISLHEMFDKVRYERENELNFDTLSEIWLQLKLQYPEEWLLPLEILELIALTKDEKGISLEKDIYTTLKNLASTNEEIRKLITDGIHLITNRQFQDC